MRDFNKTFLIGNLVKDPVYQEKPSGKKFANIVLAVNHVWKNGEGVETKYTSYFDCIAYDNQAKVVSDYLKKGRRIFIEGRLKQKRWPDKKTGKTQSKVRVIMENFHFMDKKPDSIPPAAGAVVEEEDFDISPSYVGDDNSHSNADEFGEI
jgi:single-strand DNA-binding protein